MTEPRLRSKSGERPAAVNSPLSHSARKLALLPLIAATYYMVAGGPYGIEDVVEKTGYRTTLLILLLVPLLWSLPTALMVSELASALPKEGGFYEWVKRAMGPFWGYQEAWLTMAGSFFDMALYPTLFVSYLSHFAPMALSGHWKTILGLTVIAICTLWNISGARAVGGGSLLMAILMFGPFLALVVLSFFHKSSGLTSHPTIAHPDLLGAVLITMWNCMGWDNASTIAEEVDRPQRNYPLAMAGALALVTLGYLIPIAAVARTGLNPNIWTTGGFVDLGSIFGGEALAAAMAIGGILASLGAFNSLMLSLSRIPLAMTQDGYLPRIFALRHPRTGVPWVAVVGCAIGWTFCFQLGFEPLVVLDILVTGSSILLEFCALVVLRVREPNLARPYRIPGGFFGTAALCAGPTLLMLLAFKRSLVQDAWGFNALALGFVLMAAGPIFYLLTKI